MSLSNITHIDHSKLDERNTSRKTVLHEHFDHLARRKITLDQRWSHYPSWIDDGQSELLVLGQVSHEVPRGALRKRLGFFVGGDLVIVGVTPVSLIEDVRPRLRWPLDDRCDT